MDTPLPSYHGDFRPGGFPEPETQERLQDKMVANRLNDFARTVLIEVERLLNGAKLEFVRNFYLDKRSGQNGPMSAYKRQVKKEAFDILRKDLLEATWFWFADAKVARFGIWEGSSCVWQGVEGKNGVYHYPITAR